MKLKIEVAHSTLSLTLPQSWGEDHEHHAFVGKDESKTQALLAGGSDISSNLLPDIKTAHSTHSLTLPQSWGRELLSKESWLKHTPGFWVRNLRGNTGSTLIEVIVTMALVAILVTVVTLRINIRTSRVDGAAALLETHLLEVKEMAMATRQIVGIRFDTLSMRYEGVAVPSETGTAPEWKQTNPFANQPLNVEMDVESLATDFPNNTICFDRLGRPADVQGTVLNQRYWIEIHSGGRTQRLAIEPITGWIGQ